MSQHPALGIDYGEARLGIAATDVCGIMAHPVETIHRQQIEPLARIAQIIRERGIACLVIGLPLRLDGSVGDSAKKVLAFAKQLQTQHPALPVFFVNECFTTTTASEKLHAAGKNSKKQRAIIDQAAAVEILNLWMECPKSVEIDT